MVRKQYSLFAGILFAAILIRLWLAPMRGHVHDIEQLKGWTKTAVLGNPLAVYNDSTANYPPLGLLPLIGVGHFYQIVFSPEFDTSTTTLTALLKLPGIMADLVTAVILFFYLDKHHNRRWAFIGMAVYAFNPAVIYNSAWWGQLESVVALPMLLSVMAVGEGRIRWAWLWLAVAVLVKPQAAVLGPVILLASLRVSDWRKLLEGWLVGGAFGLVVLLPLVVVGQLPVLIAQIQASAGRQLFLTMNAHNFWYLVTLGRGSFAAREMNPIFDTEPLVGPLTGWQIGLGLFLLWTGLICWKLGRVLLSDRNGNTRITANGQLPTVFWAAAALVIGFYMLPAEAHERYLFGALALLVPLLPGRRPFQVVYLLFSVTFLLNLLWVDSAVPLPGFSQSLLWGVPIAGANVVLLGYLFATGIVEQLGGRKVVDI